MTPDEFQKRLTAIAQKIPAIIQASMEQGVNTLYSEMDNRIFNKNQTISGASFGGYESEEYKQLRLSLGRQVAKKDLQFYGNLRKSMGVSYQKRAVIVNDVVKIKSAPNKNGVVTIKTPQQVINEQEYQILGTPGTGIFEASEQEAKQAAEVISYWWGKLLKEAIETGSVNTNVSVR